jgi:DNA-binding CsgD family transcriptional regulator
MFAVKPVVPLASVEESEARRIIQQQIRDIVSALSPGMLSTARASGEPAAVRFVSIGQHRYRIVVDALQASAGADPVPVATVQRIETAEPPEQRVRRRFRLTEKEAHVALLLAQRRSNAEIASALQISRHTARRHTENVMLKLNVSSRFLVEDVLTTA